MAKSDYVHKTGKFFFESELYDALIAEEICGRGSSMAIGVAARLPAAVWDPSSKVRGSWADEDAALLCSRARALAGSA